MKKFSAYRMLLESSIHMVTAMVVPSLCGYKGSVRAGTEPPHSGHCGVSFPEAEPQPNLDWSNIGDCEFYKTLKQWLKPKFTRFSDISRE